MRSFDTLATPEFVLVEFNALGVSSHKSLGNVCVVQTLAITETGKAQGQSNSETKENSAEATVKVHVWLDGARLACKVAVGESSAEESTDKGGSASEDNEPALCVEEVEVEVHGVKFNEVNKLDFAEHIFVRLLLCLVVVVDVDMVAVRTHSC